MTALIDHFLYARFMFMFLFGLLLCNMTLCFGLYVTCYVQKYFKIVIFCFVFIYIFILSIVCLPKYRVTKYVLVLFLLFKMLSVDYDTVLIHFIVSKFYFRFVSMFTFFWFIVIMFDIALCFLLKFLFLSAIFLTAYEIFLLSLRSRFTCWCFPLHFDYICLYVWNRLIVPRFLLISCFCLCSISLSFVVFMFVVFMLKYYQLKLLSRVDCWRDVSNSFTPLSVEV